MCSNYPRTKLKPALQRKKVKKKLNICHHVLTSSTQLQEQVISCRVKNENVCEMSKNEKMHVQRVQNYCFSLSNMQICHVLVAIGFMVA